MQLSEIPDLFPLPAPFKSLDARLPSVTNGGPLDGETTNPGASLGHCGSGLKCPPLVT